MNTLAVSSRHVAFAGKTSVYFRTLSISQSTAKTSEGEVRTNLPDLNFSQDWTAKNAHIECIAVRQDEKMMIAVADSTHGLQVFEICPGTVDQDGKTIPPVSSPFPSLVWKPIFNCNTNKRLIKLQFTSDGNYLTFLDKQGDIFAVCLSSGLQQQVSKIRRILGHTSFISNYVACEKLKQIVSCDRDEKIRISSFSDGYVIQGFKLGHTESVINVALIETSAKDDVDNVQENRFLLSISVSGVLMLWDFQNPTTGTETSFLKRRNIKEILSDEFKDLEVQSMKACLSNQYILVAVTFTGCKKVCIFKLSMSSKEIQLIHEAETASDMVVIEWAGGHETPHLIVYLPQIASARWWNLETNVLSENSLYDFSEEMAANVKALGEAHKPSLVPMKKRQTNFEDNLHIYPDLKKST